MRKELTKTIVGSIVLLLLISSCNFTQKIKNGKMAYERKQYYVAVDLLNKEYEANEQKAIKAELAYYLGKSYQKINNNRASINWYKDAYKLNYGPDVLTDLAFALKQEELYEEAISIFKKLEEEKGVDPSISREISICQLAAEWKAQLKEKEYQISALNLNSGSGDYAATLYEEDYIVFTSDRKMEEEAEIYNWTGNGFSDIYISQKDGSAQSRPFDRKINSKHNDGTSCFNSYFNEMYFTRCYSPGAGDSYCKLMVSFRQGKVWTEPQTLDFFDDGLNYGQPALSQNDSTLFFSCNHPEGQGGYDLYYSTRTTSGWTPPKPMPSPINTAGDEKFPTVHGDTLFFSSDYHPGMGGLDVFKTYLRTDGTWQVPINLKAPINSGRDDFSYIIDKSNRDKDIIRNGYFSSSRKGKGNDDIFQFAQYKLEPVEVIKDPSEPEETEEPVTIYLAVKVVEKRYMDPENPNSNVIGKDPIKGAGVEMVSGANIKDHNSGSLGFFVVELEKDNDYLFNASKEGYLKNNNSFSTRDLTIKKGEKEITYNLEITLDKIFVDKEINLENIYYDYDKWDIRLDAQPSLNELSSILKQNPKIVIQLASHTDCRGEDDYNQDLSQKRAQSAVDYIISTGIDPQRIKAIGFGESQLFINCECESCTEEQHQQNRRTTFKIIDF
jgi:outer membrane protein OmpA-like peptidoglycan-associated protein